MFLFLLICLFIKYLTCIFVSIKVCDMKPERLAYVSVKWILIGYPLISIFVFEKAGVFEIICLVVGWFVAMLDPTKVDITKLPHKQQTEPLPMSDPTKVDMAELPHKQQPEPLPMCDSTKADIAKPDGDSRENNSDSNVTNKKFIFLIIIYGCVFVIRYGCIIYPIISIVFFKHCEWLEGGLLALWFILEMCDSSKVDITKPGRGGRSNTRDYWPY